MRYALQCGAAGFALSGVVMNMLGDNDVAAAIYLLVVAVILTFGDRQK